jgi:hypothetical protein
VGANATTTDDDNKCIAKLFEAFIGKEDSVSGELFED